MIKGNLANTHPLLFFSEECRIVVVKRIEEKSMRGVVRIKVGQKEIELY